MYMGSPPAGRLARETVVVFGGALLLFATSATAFEARVTDLSALRLLGGEVPYRDFWTIYAPGSFTTLAVLFGLFGRELIVSNLAGMVLSAASVAAFFHLARTVVDPWPARALAALIATAFFGMGYHVGLTSYPPALLLILLAVAFAAGRAEHAGWRWAIVPGLLLGVAMVFKHDIAAYAAAASATAIVMTRALRGRHSVWTPAACLIGAAAVPPASAVIVLAALGAGAEMWRNLIVFPLTDFRYVRPEYFPLIPRLRGSVVSMAREISHWGICNLPLVAFAAGAVAVWRGRRQLGSSTIFLATVAAMLFWLHWWAAHVQLNTHAISLAAWSALLVGVGSGTVAPDVRRRLWRLGLPVLVCWWAIFLAAPAYQAVAGRSTTEWVDLPGLRGVRVRAERARWMRGLAAAMAEAADPGAPLVFVGSRNDLNIFAASTPYWLSPRRPATRHHELHPGITDTERVQEEMLARIDAGPAPVVVREHRFSDEVIERVKAGMARHVAVGSTLMDDWIARHYETGSRFGPYELMRPRSGG
jgi:hypothetical protein